MNDIILKYIPNFLESSFKSFVDNVFIQIHLGFMTGNIEKIRHFVNDKVYKNLEDRLEDLKSKQLIQMYDELNVKQTILLNAWVEEDEIFIDVNITSRYLDYLVDTDGKYVSGDMKNRVQKENFLTFKKNFNEQLGNVRKCPWCGATMDINANGKCDYCDSIYNLEELGWVLVRLEVK